MSEKNFEFENDAYDENATILSRYADIRLLEKRRKVFQEAGIWEGVVDQGISMQIEDYTIAVKCISAGLEPPENVFVCIFGDYDIATDAKRTLCIELTTAEVTTEYNLAYSSEPWRTINFRKSLKRTYGNPEFNRWGAFEEGSAMIEPVFSNRIVSDAESEILFAIIEYVADRIE